MTEYISREELLKSLTQECKDCEHDDPYWCEQCDFAIAMLYARYAPKADVQPVNHGRWIWDSNAPHREYGAYKCSNCGCHSDFEENYCYNCGARMIKDGDIE